MAKRPSAIDLQVTGPDKAEHAYFVDFLNACNALRNSLREVERCITGKSEIEYEIVKLHSSTAYLELAPISNGVPDAVEHEVESVFFDTLERIGSGHAPSTRLDGRALQSFHTLCHPLNNRASVFVSDVSIDASFKANIEKWIDPSVSSLGSVKGFLSRINVTDQRRHSFTLRPALGDDITCYFSPQKLEMVKDALKHHVTVFGRLHYAQGRSYPSRADVDDIETHPPQDDLPDLLGLVGALKDDTRDSVDIIRQQRNEWD